MWQTHTEPSYYIDHFHDSVLQTQIAIHIHFIAQRTYICRMTLFNLKVSRPVAEAGEPKHRQQDSWGTWTAGEKVLLQMFWWLSLVRYKPVSKRKRHIGRSWYWQRRRWKLFRFIFGQKTQCAYIPMTRLFQWSLWWVAWVLEGEMVKEVVERWRSLHSSLPLLRWGWCWYLISSNCVMN